MYISSYKKLGFSLLIGFWMVYFGIQVFNYFYPHNYCDRFSSVVSIGTQEELKAMSLCEDLPYCEVGDISINPEGDKKYFICERTKPAGVWKQ